MYNDQGQGNGERATHGSSDRGASTNEKRQGSSDRGASSSERAANSSDQDARTSEGAASSTQGKMCRRQRLRGEQVGAYSASHRVRHSEESISSMLSSSCRTGGAPVLQTACTSCSGDRIIWFNGVPRSTLPPVVGPP